MMAAIIVAAFCIGSGCEDNGKNPYTFENKSSYTVTITPASGEDWAGFSLEPGAKKALKKKYGGTIRYYYEPKSKVKTDHPKAGWIIIYNK